MLTLSLESNGREPGTIYRSLICKGNFRNNRSHPRAGNDSTRERFMSAPALALIVPTRSIVPGREPGKPGTIYTSWWVIDRDGGDGGDGHRLLLWSVKAVMLQAKGVLPGDIPIRGARAQHFATVWPENKVCRVCGSHPPPHPNSRQPAPVPAHAQMPPRLCKPVRGRGSHPWPRSASSKAGNR